MIGDIKGFVSIKSLDNSLIGYDEQLNPKIYQEIKDAVLKALALPIIDIAVNNSGFLVVEPGGRAIVDVNMKDVNSWFECSAVGEILLPPNLNFIETINEFAKRMTRKGGYSNIVRNMVIASSLHYGKFNDDFLFIKQ